MDALGWLWWLATMLAGFVWSVVWLLVGGWVSTALQVTLLIGVIFYLKYGWRRAPAELWWRVRRLSRLFWSWLRGREIAPGEPKIREVVRVVRGKEFGDINVSTLLSLLMLVELVLLARLSAP